MDLLPKTNAGMRQEPSIYYTGLLGGILKFFFFWGGSVVWGNIKFDKSSFMDSPNMSKNFLSTQESRKIIICQKAVFESISKLDHVVIKDFICIITNGFSLTKADGN